MTKKTADPTKVPAIAANPPPGLTPELTNYLLSLSEALDIRLGRRGDPRDRAVTVRELTTSGLAAEQNSTVSGAYNTNIVTSSGVGFIPVTNSDGGISLPTVSISGVTSEYPSKPTNFTATALYQKVQLSWDYPTDYKGHSLTEIHSSTSNVLGTATLLSITTGSMFTHELGGGQTRYYWIRHVSNQAEIGPWFSANGTVATTTADADALKTVLSGALTDAELASALNTRINLIDGAANVNGTVNKRIADAAETVNSLKTKLNGALTSSELDSSVADILTKVTSTDATLAGSVAKRIADEATARSTAISAVQTQVNNLSGTAAWSNSNTYSNGDLVQHSSNIWQSTANSNTEEPSDSASNWTKLGDYASVGQLAAANQTSIADINNISTGSGNNATAVRNLQTFQGDWTAWATGTNYTIGQVVSFTVGSLKLFKAKTNHTSADGNKPPNATNWLDCGLATVAAQSQGANASIDEINNVSSGSTSAAAVALNSLNSSFTTTGVPSWTAGTYPAGTIVKLDADGKIYRSLVETSVTPGTDASKWHDHGTNNLSNFGQASTAAIKELNTVSSSAGSASAQQISSLSTSVTTKADQSSLDTTNTNLSNLTSTVGNKADQSSLNTTNTNVSNLTTTVGNKADQSSLDTTNTNLSGLTTTVGNKADQSSLNTTNTNVSNLTTTVGNKADQSSLDTTNTNVSNLTTTVGNKADQSSLDTTNTNLTNLTTTVTTNTADITAINNISTTSTSAAAQAVNSLQATTAANNVNPLWSDAENTGFTAGDIVVTDLSNTFRPSYHSNQEGVAVYDPVEEAVRQHASTNNPYATVSADGSTGMVSYAFNVERDDTYFVVSLEVKTDSAGATASASSPTNSLFVRFNHTADNLPAGKTSVSHIQDSSPALYHTVYNSNGNIDLKDWDYGGTEGQYNGANATTSGLQAFSTYRIATGKYEFGSTTKWANLQILNWSGLSTNPIWVKNIKIEERLKTDDSLVRSWDYASRRFKCIQTHTKPVSPDDPNYWQDLGAMPVTNVSARIDALNDVSTDSTSAAASTLASLKASVEDGTTGLAATKTIADNAQSTANTANSTANTANTTANTATAEINKLNDVSSTSGSAASQTLFNLKAAVEDGTTGLAATKTIADTANSTANTANSTANTATAEINKLNDVSSTSGSATSQTLFNLKAAVEDNSTGLAATKSIADGAASTASTANNTANTANTTANTANSTANTAAADILQINNVAADSGSQAAQSIHTLQSNAATLDGVVIDNATAWKHKNANNLGATTSYAIGDIVKQDLTNCALPFDFDAVSDAGLTGVLSYDDTERAIKLTDSGDATTGAVFSLFRDISTTTSYEISFEFKGGGSINAATDMFQAFMASMTDTEKAADQAGLEAVYIGQMAHQSPVSTFNGAIKVKNAFLTAGDGYSDFEVDGAAYAGGWTSNGIPIKNVYQTVKFTWTPPGGAFSSNTRMKYHCVGITKISGTNTSPVFIRNVQVRENVSTGTGRVFRYDGGVYKCAKAYTNAEHKSLQDHEFWEHLGSPLNEISAQINDLNDISTNSGSALARKVTTVESTANGFSSSIQTNATAVAGLHTQYTVKLDSNGAMAGFGLAINTNSQYTTTYNSSESSHSTFIVNADKFSINPPDNNNTTSAVAPFTVTTSETTVGGQTVPAGVYIDNALIKNGSITTAKIGNAQIDSAQIADGAITTAKIGDAEIDNAKIVDGTIEVAKLTTAAVASLSAGTISASDITSGTMSTQNIKIQSASQNSRIVIDGNTIEVYDGTQLRVKLGDLS